jgi:hypothetical protein
MNKYQLSMRAAHGVIGTFFAGFGEDFKLREINKKSDVLLKFRHTQYAPFGVCNKLKNNIFSISAKNDSWPSTTTESLTSSDYIGLSWPTPWPTGGIICL